MERKKALLFATLAAALLIFSGASIYQTFQSPKLFVSVDTEGFLSIGKASAPIEIVLIEDFQCHNCRTFSQKVIPRIQEEYVQTGKARFTLVPVSFLTGSHSIANAALEVYKQKPKLFFTYLMEILNHSQGADIKSSDLIRLARRIGGIDLAKLQNAIDKSAHKKELESNLNWARKVMGAKFRTPSLYINGDPGSTFSFEAIQYQIKNTFGKV